MDWRDLAEKAGPIIAAIAPTLGAVLAGPLGGTAGAILAEVVTGDRESPPEEVAARLRAPSVELLAQIGVADASFKKALLEAGIRLDELHAADRADARAREIKTGDYVTPRLLAGSITLGFFGVLAWMLGFGIPQAGGEALLVMLGSLGTAWVSVVAYYFGSSAGSRAKTEELVGLAKR